MTLRVAEALGPAGAWLFTQQDLPETRVFTLGDSRRQEA